MGLNSPQWYHRLSAGAKGGERAAVSSQQSAVSGQPSAGSHGPLAIGLWLLAFTVIVSEAKHLGGEIYCGKTR